MRGTEPFADAPAMGRMGGAPVAQTGPARGGADEQALGKGGGTPGVTVKICGLRHPDDAWHLDGLPVAFAGFVFAESRRRVTPEEAAAIAAALPPGVRAVGVFVNPGNAELEAVLAAVRLDAVQLHGDEPPERCAQVRARYGLPVIKAVGVPDAPDAPARDVARAVARYAAVCDIVLLDTASPQRGGTGRRFDWHVIPAAFVAAHRAGARLWVAGGIAPENVGALVARHPLDGIDVSSGVETQGRKDPTRIRELVERVRAYVPLSG